MVQGSRDRGTFDTYGGPLERHCSLVGLVQISTAYWQVGVPDSILLRYTHFTLPAQSTASHACLEDTPPPFTLRITPPAFASLRHTAVILRRTAVPLGHAPTCVSYMTLRVDDQEEGVV